MSTLNDRIKEAMKDAMRAKDKARLSTIRLILSAIKQVEVDTRSELDDTAILAILDKMVKQRRESIKQYEDAGRQELADVEYAEIEVLQEFLPKPLTDDEIAELIEQAISSTGAESIKDMGKVMGILKPQLQGRADMGQVSGKIKSRLG
ncbi:glutamyl-tRNA amidotransferase [Kangiella profundi]|uniref:Glutamyl-tRNA amidotransferase n=1 Tax=Kangiella profundi TaxID=1561924 RepID=A0A2K9AWT4_9GAMM|nr:GatB/YqeY domain-containing protein [Kangiella profundi]AUD79591.1 glutamyl-tRNA amidotransferase [Kangiella profundi]GGE97137.1 aspartyl-tRNA amidotransferase subunit B [Kangiella profundi]